MTVLFHHLTPEQLGAIDFLLAVFALSVCALTIVIIATTSPLIDDDHPWSDGL